MRPSKSGRVAVTNSDSPVPSKEAAPRRRGAQHMPARQFAGTIGAADHLYSDRARILCQTCRQWQLNVLHNYPYTQSLGGST